MTDTENPSPTVALIGGTGGMGSAILAELVDRGIGVRAVVRRPDAIPAGEHVEPVLVDVNDREDLTGALRGVTTVVSAFNPGWQEPDLYDRYLSGYESIRLAAVDAGVERLLVIGGAASLLDEDGREFLERGAPPEPYGSGVRAARDLLVRLRETHEPDWVFLSPPEEYGPMGPRGRTGAYRIGHDTPVLDAEGHNSLSVEDLAVAVADEVQHPRFHRERFTVGY